MWISLFRDTHMVLLQTSVKLGSYFLWIAMQMRSKFYVNLTSQLSFRSDILWGQHSICICFRRKYEPGFSYTFAMQSLKSYSILLS